MIKKYAIVNTVELPCRRLVTESVNGKFYYMARAEEKNLKAYDGMTPINPTFLEDFGFTIQEVPETNLIHFRQTGPSCAKYADGRLRQWQGELDFILPSVILK
jgi:hypothetical protein